MGNDKNQPTGLYGATGAMRVWSQLFRRLPSRPLKIQGDGLEWVYLDGSRSATTDAHCPGARRSVFIAGYLPAEHVSCGEPQPEETDSGSWLDWFTGGRDKAENKDDEPAAEGDGLP
jgi:penicillin-binding protein 1B